MYTGFFVWCTQCVLARVCCALRVKIKTSLNQFWNSLNNPWPVYTYRQVFYDWVAIAQSEHYLILRGYCVYRNEACMILPVERATVRSSPWPNQLPKCRINVAASDLSRDYQDSLQLASGVFIRSHTNICYGRCVICSLYFESQKTMRNVQLL